jgi:hydroxyethylthiazole kinase-like uncharacterized protein yjeF
VVEAIFEEWPELEAGSFRAVVLCGPGNNGGDGFVVARLLKEWGWEVEVFLYGDAGKLPPDARVNYERWKALGEVNQLSVGWQEETPCPDIIIDALFGTGLARPLASELIRCLEGVNDRSRWKKRQNFLGNARAIAVDIRSGVCADSGKVLVPSEVPFGRSDDPIRASVWRQHHSLTADLTVAFQSLKLGHYLDLGPSGAGRLVVKYLDGLPRVDMGVPATLPQRPRPALLEPYAFGRKLPNLQFLGMVLAKVHSHKYTHGHALILSGGAGKGGAARLAARGALRIGAGLVTVGCPPEALAENAARLDAVMLKPIADGDALGRVLEDKRINALLLGPGLGLDDHGRDLLARALVSAEGRSLVLDADALTILSQHRNLFAALHEHCVLTPHAGEFARLFPDIAEKLAAPATKGPAYSKVDATREAAKRAGCVVLYKGPDTVIASPTGQCAINSAHYERAAPWLATAGSGDVLAGFITGLLARGFAPMQAAETAAWLHVECARKFGPGLIAEDLPEQLPAVFRDLGL